MGEDNADDLLLRGQVTSNLSAEDPAYGLIPRHDGALLQPLGGTVGEVAHDLSLRVAHLLRSLRGAGV